ncbi:hypothetical protein HPP92_000367 [Vanilla planifolia]|uniref:Uncharacterized protein n=1 Tax=Vanilla planifolia TaxID=51239 RepID=A0A835RW36_VANPL|nr:hypothetical protein HPP92_000367 [Vanilla planifolia]
MRDLGATAPSPFITSPAAADKTIVRPTKVQRIDEPGEGCRLPKCAYSYMEGPRDFPSSVGKGAVMLA